MVEGAHVEALRAEVEDDPAAADRRQKGARQRATRERAERIDRSAERARAAQDERAKPLVDVVKTLKSEVKAKTIQITAKMSGSAIGNLVNPKD